MIQFDLVTLFPAMLQSVLDTSILGRARAKGAVRVQVHALREHGISKHRVTDDAPYGGGAGMVLKPEPLFSAIEDIKACGQPLRILLGSPRGRVFDQSWADELSREDRRIVLLCGHYEGVDERVREGFCIEEFSIGDYILTGGELPALVVLDSVVRLLPGVLGGEDSLHEESFKNSLLEYPHYTRPAVFRGMKVPDILLSGNHEEISRWRHRQSLVLTRQRRPDLFEQAMREKHVTEEDQRFLEQTLEPME